MVHVMLGDQNMSIHCSSNYSFLRFPVPALICNVVLKEAIPNASFALSW